MDSERRQIVSQVAAGTLSPEEAAARLDELEGRGGAATATAALPPSQGPVRSVSVMVPLGQVTVIGDATVKSAVADGRHTARQDGDRLVIESDPLTTPGFTFGNSRGWFGGASAWKLPLVIRMNPELPLEVVVQGGRASIRSIRGPVRAAVHAGSLDIVGFEAPIDLSSEAGAIRAAGRLVDGDSRIRCGAGTVRLDLESGSSLRTTARSELGSVKLEGGGWRVEPASEGSGQSAVLGTGQGTLDIDVTVGTVRLNAS